MKNLHGTVVPIITPFTEDDKIDERSLERLTEHVIQGDLQGLYPCGTTGEMLLLSVEERKSVSEIVVETAKNRIPVFVQAGALTQKDTVELAKHAVDIGADGIGVITPVFFKMSDRDIIDYYVSISGSVPEDFPIYLYGIPQNASNDINMHVVQEVLARCKNVVGIKYSYPDMTLLQKFIAIKDFSVLVGPDHLFQAVVSVGGHGTVSGNAMIIREHYSALWKSMTENKTDLATKIQQRTNVLNSLLCSVNNIAAYKIVLKNEGIIKNDSVRAPMKTLSAQEKETLLTALESLRYKEVLI